MKQFLKKILKSLPFDFTKNQKYDSQTKKILSLVCDGASTCIDIGCHKGEVLDEMLKVAPRGLHFGFEPIPSMYQQLLQKYSNTSCRLYNIALSDVTGLTTFTHVVSNPAYSGLKQRKFDRPNEVVEQIEVRTALLDDIISDDIIVTLIKIDVEGAEYQVLKGAEKVIRKNNPVIIFEHGIGASDVYGTTPDRIFDFFVALDYQVSTMERYIKGLPSFDKAAFEEQFYKGINYYFIAYP